jgi:UDP-3-O-[3-hydroxymyristoyl] glucosamine N-acyltransferase
VELLAPLFILAFEDFLDKGAPSMKNYEPAPISLLSIRQSLVGTSKTDTKATEVGFVWSEGVALLAFASSQEFLMDAVSRPNVAAVLLDSNVQVPNDLAPESAEVFVVNNARLNFVRVHNSLRQYMNFPPSVIAPTARVHPTAVIDEVGVEIGDHTIIEPFAHVQRGTVIGSHCVLRSGVNVGSDALDIKEDENGNPFMTDHLGGVVIGDNVEIGHHSVVDRSIFRQTSTVIGNYTKIGCHSNISHGVRLGMRNKIAAGVRICGSTVVGDDNWIGPGATVSNLLTVGSRNYVALGANVLTDLQDEWKVVGIRVFKERKLF